MQEIEYGNITLGIIDGVIIYKCAKCIFQDMGPLSIRNRTAVMRKNAPLIEYYALLPMTHPFSRMVNLKRHFRENGCPVTN